MNTKIVYDTLGTEVAIRPAGLAMLRDFIARSHYSRPVIITNPTIASLCLDETTAGLTDPLVISVPVTEETKTLGMAERCWEQMQAAGVDRRAVVIGLGGGVVTDLAGFVASCYMRGVECVCVPTTLLGMVDAALGGKNGVNLGPNKNLIGTIRQPKFVAINLAFLKSLPKRELRAGLAEVIKMGFVHDVDLITFLDESFKAVEALNDDALAWVVERACRDKLDLVVQDTEDRSIRALLNFGHTYAHAIEGLTRYQRFLHGEAVSIGMVCATQLAQDMGLCTAATTTEIRELCMRAHLPVDLPDDLNAHELVHLMRSDKKANQGGIALVLPRAIGKVELFHSVPEEEILRSLGAGSLHG